MRAVEFDTLGDVDQSPIGVLLLSVGSPETTDDVEVSTQKPHDRIARPDAVHMPSPSLPVDRACPWCAC